MAFALSSILEVSGGSETGPVLRIIGGGAKSSLWKQIIADICERDVAGLTVPAAAQEEVQWLLDRGYKPGSVIEFIGSHYQLSSRQRSALQRSSCTMVQYDKRKASLLPLEAAKDGRIFIDGFNLIILLETALSGSPVILGHDGVYRDLAGVRGYYRLIGETDTALELLGLCLAELMVPEAVFYLDRPVSNSGRLRNRILEYAQKWNIPVCVDLVPNADVILTGIGRIVTGDSIILDQCTGWFNLSKKIMDDYIKEAWIVGLN